MKILLKEDLVIWEEHSVSTRLVLEEEQDELDLTNPHNHTTELFKK